MRGLLIRVVMKLCLFGFFNWVPDSLFLKIIFRINTGYKLNLKNPKTYNEKLQWLKLNNKNTIHSIKVDKINVRDFVKNEIGEKYLIPILGVYTKTSEINWDFLPEKFVIKCSHGSGSNIICSSKDKLDRKKVFSRVNRWLKLNWYNYGREYPYKYLRARIIIEKYLEENITDYKFMCFGGTPMFVQIHKNRNSKNHSLDFYNMNWEKTEIRRNKAVSPNTIEKPKCFKEMIDLASILSKNEKHVRVDFYVVKDKVFFGELTYFSASGFTKFQKHEYDLKLGDLIQI